MDVKFCGLTRAADVSAAAEVGARYAGFVVFPPSPRHLDPGAAGALSAAARDAGLAPVALTVDADDALLDAIVAAGRFAMLQLHGRESPARVAALRARHGLPVMKAVGVATAEDLAPIAAYAGIADQLLLDARPPEGAALPGGNGLAFDWRLVARLRWDGPWMLAGGLAPGNVAEAVRRTGAAQVDVSSGVESAPGVKDPALMAAFAAAAASTDDRQAAPSASQRR